MTHLPNRKSLEPAFWRRLTAVCLGTVLGLTFAFWAETGRVWVSRPHCTAWSRGGAAYYCTGWSE